MIASTEQEVIISALMAGANVVADCVAGSGKTTTVLIAAERMAEEKILQLTYNSSLKKEVRQKAAHLSNMEVHSYHSLAVKFYYEGAHTDAGLNRVVDENMPLKRQKKVKLLVIDEAQDMTLLLFKFTRKFIADVGGISQLLVMGDRFQSIYEFKGSDRRFLTLADQVWQRPFQKCDLSHSYRLTAPMASFLNHDVLHSSRIHATKAGPTVTYYAMGYSSTRLYSLLRAKMKTDAEVFVLSPSLKSNANHPTPLQAFENILVKNHHKVYYSTAEDKVLTDDVIENKIVFTTFHQAKGRERKIVVVFGVDDSYPRYFDRVTPRETCSNAMYVALTRATHDLIVIQSGRNQRLPCIRTNRLHAHFIADNVVPKPPPPDIPKPTSATDLVQFLTEESIAILAPIVDRIFAPLAPPSREPFTTMVSYGTYAEDVSCINGVALPAMYEHRRTGKCAIESYANSPLTGPTTPDFIKLTIGYLSTQMKVLNMRAQIKTFDWLSEEDVAAAMAILATNIDGRGIYESEINYTQPSPYGDIDIRGRFDVLTERTLFELKCTSSLTLEHKLQLCVYAFMAMKSGLARDYKLVNLQTGEVCQMTATLPTLSRILDLLFDNKWKRAPALTDPQFLSNCS